ncbi:MAG: glycosyltransferase [Clostridia bacterium]|nr:glycosyltransferase [Clostridia bacterium]
MAPLLSVIIPFYNGEQYAKRIGDMFLAQKSRDFELVCVDDGSTDGTLAALEELAKTELTVKVVHKENGGVSSARNAGLDHAEGKFISFVDSDDVVAPDYVSVLTDNLERKFDILVFQLRKLHEEDKMVAATAYEGARTYGNIALLTDFAKYPTRYGACNMFIAREFYEKYNFRFREGFRYYEDYEFIYRVFFMARDILLTDHQIYFYVIHHGSAIQSFNVERLTDIVILEDLRDFFKKEAPEFLGVYDIWCVSRIYWSVMWQACLAFSFSDAKKFADITGIKKKVKPLLNVTNKKERYSTWLLIHWTSLYVLAVKLLGRGRSTLHKSNDFEEFEKALNESNGNSSDL